MLKSWGAGWEQPWWYIASWIRISEAVKSHLVLVQGFPNMKVGMPKGIGTQTVIPNTWLVNKCKQHIYSSSLSITLMVEKYPSNMAAWFFRMNYRATRATAMNAWTNGHHEGLYLLNAMWVIGVVPPQGGETPAQTCEFLAPTWSPIPIKSLVHWPKISQAPTIHSSMEITMFRTCALLLLLVSLSGGRGQKRH